MRHIDRDREREAERERDSVWKREGKREFDWIWAQVCLFAAEFQMECSVPCRNLKWYCGVACWCVCVWECVQCARTQRVVCGVVSLCVCECDLLVAWSSLVSNFSFQFGAQFVLHCSWYRARVLLLFTKPKSNIFFYSFVNVV